MKDWVVSICLVRSFSIYYRPGFDDTMMRNNWHWHLPCAEPYCKYFAYVYLFNICGIIYEIDIIMNQFYSSGNQSRGENYTKASGPKAAFLASLCGSHVPEIRSSELDGNTTDDKSDSYSLVLQWREPGRAL